MDSLPGGIPRDGRAVGVKGLAVVTGHRKRRRPSGGAQFRRPTISKPRVGASSRLRRAGRVLTSVKGAVLTAGALAAAVAAIIALLPKGAAPSPALGASFVPPITVVPETSLDEYAARVEQTPTAAVESHSGVQAALPAYQPVADTFSAPASSTTSATSSTLTSTSTSSTSTPTPSTSTPTSSTSTSSTSTSTSTSSTSTPTSSTSTSTTIAPTNPSRTHILSLGSDRAAQNVANEVTAMHLPPVTVGPVQHYDAIVFPTSCTTQPNNPMLCGVRPEIEHQLQTGVAQAVAARRLVALFANSRGEVINHKLHPFGVMVTFTARLVGFQGKVATVLWSLYSAAAGAPLNEEWFKTVIAMRITPDNNDDTFSNQFWIPEPRPKGPYYVRLEVEDQQNILRTYSDSARFQ